MPLWLGLDTNANSAPKFKNILAGTGKTGANTYANVTPSGFGHSNGMSQGVFGVDITENALTGGRKVAHAGWNIVRQGTGPIASIAVSNNGSGYANTNLVRVSNGIVNAAATVATDGSGGITGIVVTTPGRGFINVATSVVAITNSTGGATGVGTGGVLAASLGGRAGRVQYECLVASGMANTANGSGAIPYVN